MGITGAVQESVYSVGQTATALGSDGFTSRSKIYVFNAGGGGPLRIGSAGVTAANGLTIASNAAATEIPTPQGLAVYAISENGTNTVRVLEIA